MLDRINVRKDKFGNYSFCHAYKKQDNTVDFANFILRFKRDVVLEDKTLINPKRYFLTHRRNKDGKVYWFYFIQEYELL